MAFHPIPVVRGQSQLLRHYICNLPSAGIGNITVHSQEKIEHYMDGHIGPVVSSSTCTCHAHRFLSKLRPNERYNIATNSSAAESFSGSMATALFKISHGSYYHCSAIHHFAHRSRFAPWRIDNPFPLMVADHWQGTQWNPCKSQK